MFTDALRHLVQSFFFFEHTKACHTSNSFSKQRHVCVVWFVASFSTFEKNLYNKLSSNLLENDFLESFFVLKRWHEG